MIVTQCLGLYMALEKTPSIGGGVFASAPTRATAIALCMRRKEIYERQAHERKIPLQVLSLFPGSHNVQVAKVA
jgi:hypothetical protein